MVLTWEVAGAIIGVLTPFFGIQYLVTKLTVSASLAKTKEEIMKTVNGSYMRAAQVDVSLSAIYGKLDEFQRHIEGTPRLEWVREILENQQSISARLDEMRKN